MPANEPKKILIITSCTGEKAVEHENELTMDDLRQAKAHIKSREAELADVMRSAEKLYTGLQHNRLMRGITAIRQNKDFKLDLYVLSAGYGLVRGSKKLAPYDATFNGMKKQELAEWAQFLNVPRDICKVLSKSYDLILVLLGDGYLRACQLDDDVSLGGPAVFFTGKASANRLPQLKNLKTQILANVDTKQFACGLVGLKGEVVARLLETFAANKLTPTGYARNPAKALDKLAAQAKPAAKVTKSGSKAKPKPAKAATKRPKARANPKVDKVIQIPSSWWDKPHKAKLKYFIPEWDDLVDGDFDFETDTHSGGGGDWSNEVYAHQMYSEPNYDGILISKVVAEKSKIKKERINKLGAHRYLRVPREFPIMGDCGAFGYINEQEPPYTTAEILDYYTRLDFDFGVSVDHLIVTATESEKQARYDMTIQNAEDFLKEHREQKLPWTPIGAVQGWDPESYAEAARKTAAMGYTYLGLGGLVRTPTPKIMEVLEAVHKVIPDNVAIHLFGLARMNVLADFARLGVRSVDSASYLRRAWMGTGQNYLTMDADLYAAIRIPEAAKSFRAKRIVSEGRASEEQVRKLERACLDVVHRFDRGEASVEETLDVLQEYDKLITPDRPDNRDVLQRVLEAAPWKDCQCDICKKDGIDVIIFRGNNRNRRRGFHNTYVFYRLVQRALAGEVIELNRNGNKKSSKDQQDLFAPKQAAG